MECVEWKKADSDSCQLPVSILDRKSRKKDDKVKLKQKKMLQ